MSGKAGKLYEEDCARKQCCSCCFQKDYTIAQHEENFTDLSNDI